jgi:hypothetical protein
MWPCGSTSMSWEGRLRSATIDAPCTSLGPRLTPIPFRPDEHHSLLCLAKVAVSTFQACNSVVRRSGVATRCRPQPCMAAPPRQSLVFCDPLRQGVRCRRRLSHCGRWKGSGGSEPENYTQQHAQAHSGYPCATYPQTLGKDRLAHVLTPPYLPSRPTAGQLCKR